MSSSSMERPYPQTREAAEPLGPQVRQVCRPDSSVVSRILVVKDEGSQMLERRQSIHAQSADLRRASNKAEGRKSIQCSKTVQADRVLVAGVDFAFDHNWQHLLHSSLIFLRPIRQTVSWTAESTGCIL